ncbi:hypothetical protein JTE90_003572 [Oedothorax gibbosus]|uniref:G-protein coupled receptors family 1 profile domain-containing protein n=1 Tax=Oedothorax gibbosus TaxID=931172 RepID=A0AAV6VK73_9ARAC|nr:hypothetical protein JTE90_003572 [Oedothorax gibbosus]
MLSSFQTQVAVVIAFFLCWTPFHAQRLMAISIQEPTDTDFIVYSFLTNISGLCYYVSATINPILYSILSLKFRHAFRDTIGRCLGKGVQLGRRGGGRSSRTMSFFNSTLKTGLEMTDDVTVVSDVPEGQGSSNGGRKVSRLGVSHLVMKSSPAEPGSVKKLKKASTISTASQQLVEAFDDATVSDYIDQMKETQA